MRLSKIFSVIILIVFTLACTNGTAPDERSEAVNEERFEDTRLAADAAFLTEYTDYTLMIMAMSETAADRAVDPQVRDFAEMLQKDHRAMYDQMLEMAYENNISLPNDMSEKLAEEVEDLRETDPMAFDEKYLMQVVGYHEIIDERARELVEKSELEPIMDFARRIISEQFVHKDSAQRLLNQLDA